MQQFFHCKSKHLGFHYSLSSVVIPTGDWKYLEKTVSLGMLICVLRNGGKVLCSNKFENAKETKLKDYFFYLRVSRVFNVLLWIIKFKEGCHVQCFQMYLEPNYLENSAIGSKCPDHLESQDIFLRLIFITLNN